MHKENKKIIKSSSQDYTMQITLVSVTLCVHESPNISVAEGSFTVYEAPSAERANLGKSGFEILAFELGFSHN